MRYGDLYKTVKVPKILINKTLDCVDFSLIESDTTKAQPSSYRRNTAKNISFLAFYLYCPFRNFPIRLGIVLANQQHSVAC